MRERALRNVLLVKAIEETDRSGELLPLADRAEATRVTVRESPRLREELVGSRRAHALERFLVARAARLRERLEPRHPILGHVARHADATPWLGRLLLLAAFALGLGLSALDGTRRIEILAFPLLGLVLWNLLVYLFLLVAAFRRGGSETARTSHWYARMVRERLDRWLTRSSFYSTPVAEALARFANDWREVAEPFLLHRAKRLFHLASMLVAAGLVAGLYVRGIGLEYRAGWESTFLSAAETARVLAIVYGPASTLTGIPLPRTPAELEPLRWMGPGSGAPAAPWIHLIAVTALLYIVLPRLLLALWSTARIAGRLLRTPVPETLVPYARELLAGSGLESNEAAMVVAYGFEPTAPALQGLGRLLDAGLGRGLRLVVREPVRYGEEDAFAAALRDAAEPAPGYSIMLFNLASTPEAENHGTALAALRDARGRHARCLAVVDQSAYAARMGEGALAARLAERTRAWEAFVAGYGVECVAVELERLAAGGIPAEAQAALRRAAQARG